MYREGYWVFSGVEVGTDNCFLEVLPLNHRDAGTLLPLIQQWVLPGSRIVTDQWAAYNGIANLPQGYQHVTVNHSTHFVDPNTGVHTQKVEGLWSLVKRKYRRINGTSDKNFESYLSEFMWRRAHKEHTFMNVLYWIRH